MRLKVRVRHGDDATADYLLSLPVGEGKRSIRWLGVAAAQQYAGLARSGGRRRRRDRAAGTTLIGGARSFLPARVSTADTPFLHPDRLICEELQAGDEVFVTVEEKKIVDEIGCPKDDRWALLAFRGSEHMAARRKMALEEEMLILEENLAAKAKELAARDATIAQQKAIEMRKIMESQLVTEDRIMREFEDDWQKMDNPVFQPLDKLIPPESEQAKLKSLFAPVYLQLSELFKSYSSVGAGVRTNDMDLIEFSSFMHDSKIFQGTNRSREVIDKVFQESSNMRVSKTAADTSPHEMDMYEFMFALIKLALIKYQVPDYDDSQTYRVGGGDARNIADSPSSAFQRLLDEYIHPMLSSQEFDGLRVKLILHDDKVLAMFHDRHPKLQQVFQNYSSAVADGLTEINADELNIAEFGMILEDSRLLGGTRRDKDDELTLKEARQAFAGAQSAPAASSSVEEGGSSVASDAMEQMNYPEFLEAIARVAVLKWENKDKTFYEKINMALDCVAMLADGAGIPDPPEGASGG